MKTHIVTVLGLEQGIYQEWRGCKEDVRGVFTQDGVLSANDLGQNLPNEALIRRVEIWTCCEADVPVVVDIMSKQWVGHDIKVFNLAQVHTRQPGEIKSKKVTNDGVFPE